MEQHTPRNAHKKQCKTDTHLTEGRWEMVSLKKEIIKLNHFLILLRGKTFHRNDMVNPSSEGVGKYNSVILCI